jgi:hypothetical protein
VQRAGLADAFAELTRHAGQDAPLREAA